uniref:Uncharacterized protein n=1 Tax=Arundo donax TaxID=35708 RepID=A0A0A8YL78_ARUDO
MHREMRVAATHLREETFDAYRSGWSSFETKLLLQVSMQLKMLVGRAG